MTLCHPLAALKTQGGGQDCITAREFRLLFTSKGLQDACPNPDDLLPGLCALAERWLGDVALPGFREAPPSSGSLADWFDDRRVALYLQVSLWHIPKIVS